MRIQHNIMAMGAYRNYTNNLSAMKKNLEKLSSGYKINRAGDDAAGLAISEKMRAQITGLETAQKNAKDGISLVQTAEGALTEVHDMLNRMVTLATQSANGTYDDTTDRFQLQKELDQLNSEINRIADSANFNGIKLLDGSMDADGRIANTTTIFSGLAASSNVKGTAVTTGALTGFGGANTNGTLELTGVDLGSTTSKADLSDQSVRYHQDAKGAGKTSFTVDLNGANYDKASAGTTFSDLVFGLDCGQASTPDTGSLTGEKTTNNVLFLDKDGKTRVEYDVTAGNNGITSEDIASAIMKAIGSEGKVYIQTGLKTGGNGQDFIEYNVTQDGDKLRFEMSDNGFNDAVASAETAAAAGKADNYFQGNFNFAVNYKKIANANADLDTTSTDKAVIDEIAFSNAVNKVQHPSTSNINEGSASSGTIWAAFTISMNC